LAKLPLFHGGSADAEWCEKHAFSTAVKQTTKPIKKFFQDTMRIIRLVRNHWIWMNLRAYSSAILGVEGSRECDAEELALKEALGEERIYGADTIEQSEWPQASGGGMRDQVGRAGWGRITVVWELYFVFGNASTSFC
jgi:hypothetical protein